MPSVSVIVPCYNEEKTIGLLLEAVYRQTYPRAEMEVILADGQSTDETRTEITRFQQDHPDLSIRIVDNLRRSIPAALNAAVAAASGTILVRLDAHSMPAANYVERSVADLDAGLGDNVGGVWQIQPGAATWQAEAIAAAAAHPLGVGDALYRYSEKAEEVDTVPFGAFRRELFERLGGFDETLLTNEDYEFNVRVRQDGGRVWLDPAIRSVYFARPTFSALARQYWRYGYWKLRMLRRYPRTLRLRQAVPPLFAGSLVILAVLSIFWWLARWGLGVELAVYLAALVAGTLPIAIRKNKPSFLIGMPLAIASMHLAWGTGFLWSLVVSILKPEPSHPIHEHKSA